MLSAGITESVVADGNGGVAHASLATVAAHPASSAARAVALMHMCVMKTGEHQRAVAEAGDHRAQSRERARYHFTGAR
jgi:hypothetical protein